MKWPEKKDGFHFGPLCSYMYVSTVNSDSIVNLLLVFFRY